MAVTQTRILVLDDEKHVVLGDIDGYSVARELKDFETVKIEMSKLILENFNGRAEFLPKPFKKGDLISKVDRLTGLRTE